MENNKEINLQEGLDNGNKGKGNGGSGNNENSGSGGEGGEGGEGGGGGGSDNLLNFEGRKPTFIDVNDMEIVSKKML